MSIEQTEQLRLSQDKLQAIALSLKQRIEEGLCTDEAQVKCLPSYIPKNPKPKPGMVLAVDLGGTRLRVAMAQVKQDKSVEIVQGPITKVMNLRRPGWNAQRFFLEQAKQAAALNIPEQVPIGYCFSYPAEITPERDGILLRWTKGIDIPNVIGKKVGYRLVQALGNVGVHCGKITVLNDTVTSLVAGLAQPMRCESYIGLIVGTGTNMATFFPTFRIKKLGCKTNFSEMAINLESGNFHPPFLCGIDDEVDAASDNPGFQRFEKAVSGVYLSRILARLAPDYRVVPDSGSEGISAILQAPDAPPRLREVAGTVLQRSADLVAAGLAGLIASLNFPATVKIVAEGGLFWGAAGYSERVKQTLQTLLNQMSNSRVSFQIVKIDQANLVGAALGAKL